MNSKEIMVNLMVEKVCEYIDAGDIHRIVVHGKEFAEVKKGKWIYTHGDYFKVRCGVCGFANQCEDNFCPKCGADMRKETDKGETHD